MGEVFEFDIIIVTWNRPDKVIRCLKSISQSYTKPLEKKIKFNVYVLVNGIDPKTETALYDRQMDTSYKINIHKCQVRSFPGAARNQLLRHTHCPWKFFLDDDAWLIENYFEVLNEIYQKHIRQNSVRYIAGPNLTFTNSSYFAQLSQFVLENPFYAPYVYKRYAKSKIKTDSGAHVEIATEAKSILCNFWLNQIVLANMNPTRQLDTDQVFDARLMGGEESELVHALEANKIDGIFSPELAVWHERRTTWLGFFKQMIKYGEGRGVVIKYHRRLSWFHVVPVVFLVLFCLSLFLGFASLVSTSYLIFLVLGSLYSVKTNGLRAFSGLVLAPIVHIGYAIGLIKGIFS